MLTPGKGIHKRLKDHEYAVAFAEAVLQRAEEAEHANDRLRKTLRELLEALEIIRDAPDDWGRSDMRGCAEAAIQKVKQ